MHERFKIVLTVLLFFGQIAAKGQTLWDKQLSGQGAYGKNFTNVFGGFHNQAALAELQYFTAGAYISQRFSMQALNQLHFAVAWPAKPGTISVSALHFGYPRFHRQQLEAGYARKLFDWLEIGAAIDYLNMQVAEYGRTHAVTFTLAVLAPLHPKWRVGIQVFNPWKVHYQKLGNDAVPDIWQFGLGYQPSNLFLLTAELQYQQKKIEAMVSFLYRIAPVLSLQAGASTGTSPISAGIQLHLNKLEILLSVSYHDQLEWTPGSGFIFVNKLADEL